MKSKITIENAERLYSFITGVTDYAIYMLSPNGTIESWNAGARKFKGYESDEIIGQHFSRFYTLEDQAAELPSKALKTAEEEGKFEGEGWRVRKDGTRFWALVVIDAIRDNDSRLIGFTKITRDVTRQKEDADAFLRSEQQFRLLVQGVTDYAIYMLSPDGIITNWNAGAERIKGYRRDEVVGTHFSRFFTTKDQEAGLPAKALKVARDTGRFESEGIRVRKDGSEFWTHAVIDLISDEEGNPIGFAKVTRDVTERREAAQALEQAKEALFHSQKLEAIGKLTGGVAHDFNNLLGVIVNGIEILSREQHTPAIAKTLEAMERAASRGANLTQQLLAFARQSPLKQTRQNLNEVISAFEAVLRRACKSTVKFNVMLEDGIPEVLIDPVQFESALLNLVCNADEAMPEGGNLIIATDVIELGHHQVGQLSAGLYVKVSIEDSGVGMAAKTIARSVEPFFTTKAPGKGTGLGLSQVHGLIQQSNGDIVIESELGSGTFISFYLPVLKDSKNDETPSLRTCPQSFSNRRSMRRIQEIQTNASADLTVVS